jgi:hypothetical protein
MPTNSLGIRLLLMACSFLCIRCGDWITGSGPQPIYLDDSRFMPMLNILGVLRPDSANGLPRSYVHIEKAYSANQTPDSTAVTNAKVTIFEYLENESIDSIAFSYTSDGSAYPTSDYRNIGFSPTANRTYGISCERNGYPNLTARTKVPSVPQIVNDSFQLAANQLSFSIVRDSLAALYDLYLFVGEETQSMRIQRPETGDIPVIMNLKTTQSSTGLLIIYAYDFNLSEYMTFNVNIKPNAYRSAYSTVENGFGCFGSLNVLRRNIAL